MTKKTLTKVLAEFGNVKMSCVICFTDDSTQARAVSVIDGIKKQKKA